MKVNGKEHFDDVNKKSVFFDEKHRNRYSSERRAASYTPQTIYSKDDLFEKIDREFDVVSKTVRESGDFTNNPEAEIKKAIRDTLHDITLYDETVQALMATENILDDAYDMHTRNVNINDLCELVTRYVEIIERDYLADRLFIRAKAECEAYIDEVKKMPKTQIIGEAYKIVAYNQICNCLDPVISELGTFWLKGLLSFESPVLSIYNGCKNDKGILPDYLADAISDFAGDKAFELGVPYRCADEQN